MSPRGEITELLAQARLGDSSAKSHLAEKVYYELHRIATRHMRNERPDHSLRATALVDDAYVHLVLKDDRSWQNRSHFFAVASQMMRRILIDHARSRNAAKRGGPRATVCLDDVVVISEQKCEELLAVDEALSRLAERDPELSRIVEMRFFAGLTEDEVAEVLGVSSRKVRRDWKVAKAWLYAELSGASTNDGNPVARVKDVTADALECVAAKRAEFLAHACGDDPEVYSEALRLVSQSDTNDVFLADPPLRLKQFLQQPSTPYFSAGQVVAGRFEILQFLNRGGMGEVYSAMDLELKEKVALKTIHPAIASSPSVIERFKQEVRQARRISHTNICRVYDLFSDEGSSGKPIWFLTMQLLEGCTLAERLAEVGPLPLDRALPIIRDMVHALSAAHDLGIVHRDFKPNNLMLVRQAQGLERAVVTDFGLAQGMDSELRDVVGTPAYMAPEQAAGGATTPAADQFSLGLVICELLTGTIPTLDRTDAAAAKRELQSGCPVTGILSRPAFAERWPVAWIPGRRSALRTFGGCFRNSTGAAGEPYTRPRL